MYSRYFNFFAFCMVLFLLSGCKAAPLIAEDDLARKAAAKRFLHNIGAGELAMAGYMKEFEKIAIEQPGVAEFTKRAFADMSQEDLENLAAESYARHLSHEDLLELSELSDKPAIKKFFKTVFDGLISGKPVNKQDMLKQFDADELTQIMKLSFSDSFNRMKSSLPEINREMAQAAKKMGHDLMQNYLKTL